MFVNIAMVVGPFCGLLILDVAGAQALFLFLAIIGLIGFYAANRKPLPASLSTPPPQVQLDILPTLKDEGSYQLPRFAWATFGGFLLLTSNEVHFTSATAMSSPDFYYT